MLLNPSAVLVAFAQEVNLSINPINENNFVSGNVTASASITDVEAPITNVTFTIFDYYEEVEESCSGEQGGDDGSNWSCQIDTTNLEDSNDELYDLQVDYEDENGNSYTAYYSDNNNYFDIDNNPPQDPYVGSSSHEVDIPSNDNTIDIFLEGADDNASGVDGFSFSFTQEPEDLPDENKDIDEDIYQITSEELSDGSWYFHLRTVDYSNNWTSTVHLGPFIIDTGGPIAPSGSPEPGDYDSNQEVSLSSNDDASGVSSLYYTQDDTDPSSENGNLFENPITVDRSMSIRAIAYDNAGNSSLISNLLYGIAPVISQEATTSTASASITVNWTTNNPSTSRVIYDIVTHESLGSAPNYGYAFSTVESDTSPKVTSHTVILSNLTPGTTYYYRTVSKGSPEAVGGEKSFTTQSPPPQTSQPASNTSVGAGGSSSGGGNSEGPVAAPVCSDTKPASAPMLLSASAAKNSVALKWSEGQDPISYYLVAYGLTPGKLQYGNPNIGGKGTTSYTVQALSGGTTYYFRVRAGNGCMPGEFSNELSATPLGDYVESPGEGFKEGVLGTQNSTDSGSPSDAQDIPSQPNFNLIQAIRDFFDSIFGFATGFFGR